MEGVAGQSRREGTQWKSGGRGDMGGTPWSRTWDTDNLRARSIAHIWRCGVPRHVGAGRPGPLQRAGEPLRS
eukprot:9800243-Lingulodinium_polyedra.AAC.1